MNDQEGSKAMTIYIVACFVLAMVALVGYKFKNEEREELAAEYVDLNNKFADIHQAYAPNINDYYRKVATKQIQPHPNKEFRDQTHVRLREIANELGIQEADKRLVINVRRPNYKFKQYWEYSVEVKLDKVTQTEWATFLSNAQVKTREYAHVARIDVKRDARRFNQLSIVADNRSDRSLWQVSVTFVWFGPKTENPT
jgi:hypothetical protein